MNIDRVAAENLATAIRQVAKKAHSEEDLRVGVEHALSATLAALGLTAVAEYEKTTFSGSADAVYGHVVIEYKRPGRLAEKGYPATLATQIARYLTDLARPAGSRAKQIEALERMVGVGLDGEQMLFLRYSATGRKRESPLPPLPGMQLSFLDVEEYAGGFQVVGPVPVGRESVELLLLYLRSLSRKPLTPEALADDFGPQGEIASRLVNAFYGALQAHRDHPRVATFFAEWDRIFGIVYGEELGAVEKNAPELAALYRAASSAELKPLFFAVHTYYALLMKFLAVELASLQGGALVGSFIAALPAATEEQLRGHLINLENGGTFALLGINNFLEGDFFGWYLDVWSGELADSIRALARQLADFEPATSTLEPTSTRDLLKKLYQYLVPRKLRHDLGEYYTPDWLAERLLNQVGYKGEPDKRLIDPACGSGTFLILALRRLRQHAADHLIPPAEVLDAALKNTVGFDLNPLSVIAARTNYLLALGDLLRYRRGPVDLPVYMCDSILTPTERADLFGRSYRLHTVVGDFDIPGETVAAGEMGALSALLEACVRDGYAPQEFLARARRELTAGEPMTETALEALYRRFLTLQEEGRNSIWARLIKNAFAPVLVGEFDFVVGNPPWVRWGYLSSEYKEATKRLWFDYGLFSLEGGEAQLGGGEKDLSMLFTYVSADRYLKSGGRLGFVITQVVFKAKGAGEGFRRFRLGEGEPLSIVSVDDMVDLQPFVGVSNRTAILVLLKGKSTRYPVAYTRWLKAAAIHEDMTLDQVAEATKRRNLYAEPAGEGMAGPWRTGSRQLLRVLKRLASSSVYAAHIGARTDPYGVYWMRVLEALPDGRVVIENLPQMSKTHLPTIRRTVKPDLLFPAIKGADVLRWKVDPRAYVLMVQDVETRMAYDESWLKIEYPDVYSYLKEFEQVLRSRGSRAVKRIMERSAFYAMFAIGSYTFAEHKVVWRRMDNTLRAAVVGRIDDPNVGDKVLIPIDTVTLVATKTVEEAHFVCALMNSNITRMIVSSFSASGRGFGTPSILEHVPLQKYRPSNPTHAHLAELSQQAHALAAQTSEVSETSEVSRRLAMVEAQVDEAAAELWSITDGELAEIRRSLGELA